MGHLLLKNSVCHKACSKISLISFSPFFFPFSYSHGLACCMRHGWTFVVKQAIIRAKRHLISLFCLRSWRSHIHSVSCHITSIFLISSAPKSIQTSQGNAFGLEDFPFSPLMSHFVVVVPAIHSRIQEDPDLAPSYLIRIDIRAQSLPPRAGRPTKAPIFRPRTLRGN